MIRPSWLLPVLVSLACFAMGFGGARWWGSSASGSTSETASTVISGESGASSVAAAMANDPLVESLEAEFAALLANEPSRVPADFAGPFSGEALAALAAACHRTNTPETQAVLRYAEAWAKHDPRGMFEYFVRRGSLRLPLGRGGWTDLSWRWSFGSPINLGAVLFTAWLEKDREAGLDALRQASSGLLDTSEFPTITEKLWELAPEEAVRLMSREFNREASQPATWFRWQDVELATVRERFVLMQEQAEEPARGRMTAAFFKEVGEVLPAVGKELWTRLDPAAQDAVLQAGYRPAFDDPAFGRARQLVEAEASPREAAAFVDHYASQWAWEDLPGALQWAQRHVTGEPGLRHLAALLRVGFSTDAGLAAAELARLPASSRRDRVLDFLAVVEKSEEALAAQPWFDPLPAEEQTRVLETWKNRRFRPFAEAQ